MLDLSTVDPSVHQEHLRDFILRNHPEPPRCANPEHGSPSRFRNACAACATYIRWCERVNRRFREHGIERNLRPTLDLSAVDPSARHQHLLDFIQRQDPEPTRCDNPEHGNPDRFRQICATCATYARWRHRVNQQFKAHGMKRNPPPADDPRPSCRHEHTDPQQHAKTCTDCRAVTNWMHRERNRKRRAGIPRRFTDMPRLREHVDALEAAGMVTPDIAAAAAISSDMLWDLRTHQRAFARWDIAQRLLAVPIPQRRLHLVRNARGQLRRQVDATGTKRRIRCAQNEGHNLSDQAARLGWNEKTLRNWLRADNVSVDAADAMATLYPQLIAQPGNCSQARTVTRRYPWARARYFSETNIDDPTYDPFRMIRRLYGMQRRLRAMAYIGQGPEQVATRIDEPAETVRGWTLGHPAPAYALHLVAEDYERWCSTLAPDQEAADLAREMGWASPMAWDDVNIDSPTAQPRRGVPTGTPASSLVLYTMVLNALDGKATRADLMSAELEQVVTILHRRRWSDRRIAVWLRWHPDGDHDKGRAAVLTFRTNHGITGYGPLETGASDDAANGLIVVPAAA